MSISDFSISTLGLPLKLVILINGAGGTDLSILVASPGKLGLEVQSLTMTICKTYRFQMNRINTPVLIPSALLGVVYHELTMES